jgi:hypothetical protein
MLSSFFVLIPELLLYPACPHPGLYENIADQDFDYLAAVPSRGADVGNRLNFFGSLLPGQAAEVFIKAFSLQDRLGLF